MLPHIPKKRASAASQSLFCRSAFENKIEKAIARLGRANDADTPTVHISKVARDFFISYVAKLREHQRLKHESAVPDADSDA